MLESFSTLLATVALLLYTQRLWSEDLSRHSHQRHVIINPLELSLTQANSSFFPGDFFARSAKKSPGKRKSTVLPQAHKQVSESPIRFIPGFVHAQTKFGGEAAAEPSPYNKVCTGFGTPSLAVAMMRLKEQRRATRVFL